MKKLLLILVLSIFLFSFASANINIPTAYWKFNEAGFPTIANDSQGISNFTLNNTVIRMQIGKLGNSIRINNSNINFALNSSAIPNSLILDNNTFTIAFWINGSNGDGGTGYEIIGRSGNTVNQWSIGTTSGVNNVTFNSNNIIQISAPNITMNGSFNRVVFVREGSGTNQFKVYVNNINYANKTLANNFSDNSNQLKMGTTNGASTGINIDDLRIYNNYAWTVGDVSADWNSGFGVELRQEKVVLNSPAPNQFLTSSSFIFNSTIIGAPTISNFINASYYIYYSNNSLFKYQTNTTLVNNNSVLNITGFSIPSQYYWDVFACGRNTTNSIICLNSITPNITFTWGYNENSITFNASTIETSSEGFRLNVSISSSVSLISARLFYNNTYYPSTKTTSGLNTLFDNILSIPSTTSQVNKTFFWELNLDGTLFNTTNNNQIVNTLNLGVCSGSTNVRVFNFTSALETNLTRVNPYSFEGTFDYFIGDGSTVKSVSISNTSIAEVSLCVSDISKNINLDAEISYGFEGVNLSLVSRKYFFQDAVITNSTQNITLLLLDSEDATTFILKVLDNSVQPVADALISILRYYPGEGIFRTVQIAKTDSTGQTVGFYEAETVTYKHIITKNGVVLLDTGQGGIVVGQSIPFTLTFTVGDSLVAPWTYLNANSTILTSLSYNKTSELVTFSYIDPTGSANLGRLHVYQDSLSNNTVTTICDTPTTGSSATINCNMSGQSGTFVAKGYVTTSTNLQKVISFIVETARAIFDKTGAFMGWLILITVAMSVLWNPSVGVVLINVAIIFLGVIGLLVFSPIAYFSLIGISIILLILFRT